jgi:Na+/alanine symporter
MRVEYNLEMSQVETPRFAVEALEGMGKLFSLATLVLNVLETKESVEIVFHGLSQDDPQRRIASFKAIMASCSGGSEVGYSDGQSGTVPGSSSAFQWLKVSRA